MTRQSLTSILVIALAVPAAGRTGTSAGPEDADAVRRTLQAVAAAIEAKDLAALDTLFAHEPWVRIVEGTSVDSGWRAYRDHHLKPELDEFHSIAYRYDEIEPQVRGTVAWATFRYELAVHTNEGPVEVEGRGTAVLEKRDASWRVVHLHTSGRRRAERQR